LSISFLVYFCVGEKTIKEGFGFVADPHCREMWSEIDWHQKEENPRKILVAVRMKEP
jgi:hypothetical protein